MFQATIKSSLSHLEDTFLKVVESPESYPAPGRSLRKLVSRCLVLVYTRADTRTMFDTLQRLLKLVIDLKPTGAQDINKTCVISLLGVFLNLYSAVQHFFVSVN